MPKILAYSDSLDSCLELITLGTQIGGPLSVTVLGSGDLSAQTKKLSVGGVSNIYEISHESLDHLLAGPIIDALETVSKKINPDLILLSSTKRGKELAGRLAARLKMGCISDAIKLTSQGAGFSADRLVWGGNAIATVSSKSGAVVTIPQRAYERASSAGNPSVLKVTDFQPETSKVSFVGKKEKPKGQVNIKDAEIIVSAGRGFKKREDLVMLENLASVINAVVGASRPLTSDLGWVSEDRQVGLSGTTVKPKLYIAVGISGQIQHLTGMRDSKVIVAINTDKNAPIFQECDYGIVGDLYALIPELTKDFKGLLGR